MSSPPKPIIHTTFFTESNRILAANKAHLLSPLFPLSIFLTSLLSFLHFTISKSIPISLTSTSILLSFLYALFLLSLYVSGIATITYTTQHGLYGKPPNLSSAIGSISNSFFPLASTTLASIACLLITSSIAFLLFSASFLNSLRILLGLNINYNGFRLIIFVVIILLLLILFHVIITLAAVISVVESKWWFEPLRTSFFLIKGMKRSSFLILLLRGISIWAFIIGISLQIFITAAGPWNYVQVLQILNVSMFWTILLAPLVIQYTVLYLTCKDLHEESGFDIAVEVSKECVGLAIDDKKLVRESNVKILALLAAFMVLLVTLIVAVKLEII